MDRELLDAIRAIVREEIQLRADSELLTPEELAERLKVPRSWVYEHSRNGKIAVIRSGDMLDLD